MVSSARDLNNGFQCLRLHIKGCGKRPAIAKWPSPLEPRTRHLMRGGVVDTPVGVFETGGGFWPEHLARHINAKEMFALHEVLAEYCRIHPCTLQKAQLLMDVENQAVVQAFQKGRAKDKHAHALLGKLFHLQVKGGYRPSLKWVPTAKNGGADAITRSSRKEMI